MRSKGKRTARSASLDRSIYTKTARVNNFNVPTQNRSNVLDTGNSSKNTYPKPTEIKPKWPPPLTITNQNTKLISDAPKQTQIQHNIKITSVGIKIYVNNDNDFSTLGNKLEELKIEFFTHQHANTKLVELDVYLIND